MRSKISVGLLILLCGIGMNQIAQAGTIILEGSDAIGYHSGSNAAATAYRDQVWLALSGSDARPIAIIGTQPVSAGFIGTNTHPIAAFSDIAAAGSLNDYVALYFLSPSGCCGEYELPASNDAAVSAYLAAGGTIMIENYTGGSAWDFAVGAGGAGNAHVAGYLGGLPGATCSDNEIVTADGLFNGFTQPSPMSCWTHQAYDVGFFGPLGFTHSYFLGGQDYPKGFSSLLSNGYTQTGDDSAVPEPGSLLLLGTGLTAIGCLIGRQRRQK